MSDNPFHKSNKNSPPTLAQIVRINFANCSKYYRNLKNVYLRTIMSIDKNNIRHLNWCYLQTLFSTIVALKTSSLTTTKGSRMEFGVFQNP